MTNQIVSKYCFVPDCNSNSFVTPYMRFIPVPRNESERRKWFRAVDLPRSSSKKSGLFCCEKHFNMHKDVERCTNLNRNNNFMLKKGVVPHIFPSKESSIEGNSSVPLNADTETVPDTINNFNHGTNNTFLAKALPRQDLDISLPLQFQKIPRHNAITNNISGYIDSGRNNILMKNKKRESSTMPRIRLKMRQSKKNKPLESVNAVSNDKRKKAKTKALNNDVATSQPSQLQKLHQNIPDNVKPVMVVGDMWASSVGLDSSLSVKIPIKRLPSTKNVKPSSSKTKGVQRERAITNRPRTILPTFYNCVDCDFKSKTESDLVEHVRKEHSKNFMCLTCGFVGNGTEKSITSTCLVNSDNNSTASIENEEKKVSFLCKYCSFSSFNSFEMKNHISKTHILCPLCITPMIKHSQCLPKKELLSCKDLNRQTANVLCASDSTSTPPSSKKSITPSSKTRRKTTERLPSDQLLHSKNVSVPQINELKNIYTCEYCKFVSNSKPDLETHLLAHVEATVDGTGNNKFNFVKPKYTYSRMKKLKKNILMNTKINKPNADSLGLESNEDDSLLVNNIGIEPNKENSPSSDDESQTNQNENQTGQNEGQTERDEIQSEKDEGQTEQEEECHNKKRKFLVGQMCSFSSETLIDLEVNDHTKNLKQIVPHELSKVEMAKPSVSTVGGQKVINVIEPLNIGIRSSHNSSVKCDDIYNIAEDVRELDQNVAEEISEFLKIEKLKGQIEVLENSNENGIIVRVEPSIPKVPETTEETITLSYQCMECDSSFESSFDLQHHLKVFHSPGTYYCSICNCFFNDQNSLDLHLSVTHYQIETRDKSERIVGGCFKFVRNPRRDSWMRQMVEQFFQNKRYSFISEHIPDLKAYIEEVVQSGKYFCPLCESFWPCIDKLKGHFLSTHININISSEFSGFHL